MSFLSRVVESLVLLGLKIALAGRMPVVIQRWAFAAIERWAVADSRSIRYRLAADIQPHLSEISGYPLCSYCRWVEWPGEPHKCCREAEEQQRQTQKEVDAAWAEEERRRREKIEKSFREAQSKGLL